SGGDNPLMQRKNANDSNGNCSGTQKGVDLNRNVSFHWSSPPPPAGASDNPCAETYQGPTAMSEPENSAYEELIDRIYPKQRPPDDNTPAPKDARGTLLTLHSYGNDMIYIWGWTNDEAPNTPEYKEVGALMAKTNGYVVSNNAGTVGYLTTGTHDD